MKESLETATARYEKHVIDPPAWQYLLDRGISPESIKDFRLGLVANPISDHERYRGCVSIPSLGPSSPYGLRFRSLDSDGPKYLGLPGVQTRLFNIRALHHALDTVCITEGEFDTVILSQCGLHSVGVTGADSWKRHHPRMFAGFQKVFVFGDGDNAGQKFAKSVCDTLTNSVRINVPSGLDVNDLYLKSGKDAIMNLMEEK